MFPKHDHIGFVMVGKNFFFFFLDFPASSSSFSSSPLVAPKLVVVPSSRSSFSKQSLNSNSNRSAFVTHDKFSGNGTKSSCFNLVFSCARFKNGLTQVNVTRENSEAVSRFDFSISVVAVISVVSTMMIFLLLRSREEEEYQEEEDQEEEAQTCIVLSCSRVAENKERLKALLDVRAYLTARVVTAARAVV
jgi:hypothetical protein